MSHPAPHVELTVRTLKNAVPAEGGHVPFLARFRADEPEVPKDRTPLDLVLVLDRSGSMGGAPIEAARAAAHDAVDLLEEGDRLSLVTFDHQVDVLVPPTEIDDRGRVHMRIDHIQRGGRTALHAGWVEGSAQLVDLLDPERSARIVLLTDGQANVGETDASRIADDVRAMAASGIITSSVGLGPSFEEDLLTAMADAGGGRFAYAEDATRLEGVMAAELAGIDAVVARRPRLSIEAADPGAHVMEVSDELQPEGDAFVLPELIAGQPYDLAGMLEVSPSPEGRERTLATLRIDWTDRHGQRQSTTTTVRAPVLAADAYRRAKNDREVDAARAARRAAHLRRDAVARLDAGRVEEAERLVEEIDRILAGAPATPGVERERRAIGPLRAALRRRDYGRARKQMAMSHERHRKGFDAASFAHSPAFQFRQKKVEQRKAERAPSSSFDQPKPHAPSRRPYSDPRQGRGLKIPRQGGGTATLHLRMGDITDWTGPAIVNPTNVFMYGAGPSVDGAVHRRGGMSLTHECRAIGKISLGETVVTSGHALPADYVLHTAVPVHEDDERSYDTLRSCYRTAFARAREMRLDTLAFPAIGAGSNGFPLEAAGKLALEEIADALADAAGPTHVDVVLFDKKTHAVFDRRLSRLAVARGLESSRSVA